MIVSETDTFLQIRNGRHIQNFVSEPDVLHNYLLKREEDDLDLLEAEAECAPSPAPLEAASGGQSQPQFVKKEEINYEWAQGMFSGYKKGLQESSNKLVLLLGILEVSH